MQRFLVSVWCACAVLGAVRSAAADPDIVVYASDATTASGNWTSTSSTTGAGGRLMSSADTGWSTTDAPLASPNDYVEFRVSASAGVPYHVWMRLRAAGDSKWNDSVWVQFSDAATLSGQSVYRIGTTSALLMNLEQCFGCGMSGWGWVDGAWWLSQSSVLQFQSSGTHTIRVQTREDGVQFDQIVLSPTTYLQSAPGSPVNDSTVVPKPGTSSSSSGSSSSSTPFSGSAAAIPGTIQAENFDNGGEGVAYHDSTSGNAGGAYRSTDVDLEPSSGGGYDVGWVTPGEWLQYSVNVASAGMYSVDFRVAATGQGGSFHLEMSGVNVSGTIVIPDTGGWQSYQTLTKTVTLQAGAQTARLVMDSNGANAVGNFDWIRFSASSGSSSSSSSSTPFNGSPFSIPGTIEAEQFDNGGQGVAYFDTTSGNSGGAYRSTDVDLEPASGGGYDVGWVMDGEWLQYTVNVTAGGTYTAQLRVASRGQGGVFHLEMNGSDVTGPLTVPNTGDWQSYQTVTATVTLNAGTQIARLVADSIGAAAVGNFDRIQFTFGGGSPSGGGTTVSSGSGRTISVSPSQDLQQAINSARPGDTILLTPGATYQGGIVLPATNGSDYITIRSAASDSSLPASGVRITPAYAGQLPKIQGGVAGAPAMMTGPGADHWRLQFLELIDTWPYGDILALGDGSTAQNSLSGIAHDLVVDRCYIHGTPTQEQKRGIALNSATTSIVNSYISDIHLSGGDSQAIAAWNGPGPYTIDNNYLEASGENFLTGGADPTIYGLVPSDITFTHNTVSKQPSWRGSNWVVKNLIELKNGQRITIDGNVIQYNWQAGQFGHAIVLTPRNQDGTAPWSIVQHVQITNNVIQHVAGGVSVLGTDNNQQSQPLNDVTFRNNLVLDLSVSYGGAAQLLLTNGGNNLVFDHNTVFTDGSSVLYAYGAQVYGMVFTNNIVPDNLWAIMGDSSAPGNSTVGTFFPGSTFLRNVFIGSNPALYPSGNYYPSTLFQVGFIDPSYNFRLSSSSPYASGATDGTAVGASIPAVDSAGNVSF